MKRNFAIIALCLVLLSCARDHLDFQPNILWITCEDISPFIGCYGDSEANTPNLDQLAGEGIRFTNFYANAPVCAPARFTILHGVHASSAGTMNMRSRYSVPDEWKTYPEFLREAGYYCTNNSKTDYNFFGDWDVWDESSAQAHYKNRSPGQPFFAVFNFTTTHESKVHQYNPSELIHDPNNMILPDYVPDTREIREDMARLYDNITKLDLQVGDVLLELEEEGLRDSTIVFFYSDHGGVYPRAKRYINRTGTWVPLIIRMPGKVSMGKTSDRLVSFVDLAPTLLSIAGVEIPEYMEGKAFMGKFIQDPQDEIFLFRNRMDERIDFQRAITDGKYRYHRNFMPHRPNGQHLDYLWRAASIRSWEQAFLDGECNDIQSAYWREKPFEELYDIEADPWEVNNLTGDPEYFQILASMRDRLESRMLEMRDAGAIPEGMMVDVNKQMNYPDIYSFTHSGEYPLKEVLQLSSDDYAAGLVDEHPIVRYWAAVYASSAQGLSDKEILDLLKLLEDENTEVCLAAGEALYRNGYTEDGIRAVRRGLGSDNPMVVVMAFNIMEYFIQEDQASFVEEVKELRHRIDYDYVNRLVEEYTNEN